MLKRIVMLHSRAGQTARFLLDELPRFFPGIEIAYSGGDISELTKLDPEGIDLVLLLGYMKIVPKDICERYSILNLHPGDPDRYPGKDPQKRALEAGERFMMNTIHVVTAELDKGPVVAQGIVPIAAGDTVESLYERGRTYSFPLWIETLLAWPNCPARITNPFQQPRDIMRAGFRSAPIKRL